MSTTTGKILANVQITTTNSIATGIDSPITVNYPSGAAPVTLANGTGASSINLGFADQRTLTAASVTLDVSALAAAATNTGAAPFTAFKSITIYNDSTSTGNITVGNAATAQLAIGGTGAVAFTVIIKPGGWYQYYDPSAAGQVCTTNKNLKIDSGAFTCLVTTVIQGLS